MLLGKSNRVSHPHRLLQILRFVRLQSEPIAVHDRVGGVDIAENQGLHRSSQFPVAANIQLRAQLFSLIAVKNTQRDACAHAQRVYPKWIVIG